VETVEAGMLTPNLTAAAAAGGINLQGGPTVQGLVIGGDGGITAVVHGVSGQHLTNLVINNANNRDIRQSTDITLDIPNFAQMQQDIAAQNVDLRLQTAMGVALRDAATR
jgi:FAD/FMN-containing dehydrogenase